MEFLGGEILLIPLLILQGMYLVDIKLGEIDKMLVPDSEPRFLGYVPAEYLGRDAVKSGSTFGAFETDYGIQFGVIDGGKGDVAQASILPLADGDEGTKQTLEHMADLSRQGARHPDIIRLSRYIVSSCPTHDTLCEAASILAWIQQNIRWTPDIGDAETIMAPWRTIEIGAGDCDDLSILAASLSMSIALPARFKAIGASAKNKEDFTHVYVQHKVDDQWLASDPSVDWAKIGWESPVIYKEMYEDVWTD
jgi:hypothetical protein